MKVFWGMLFLAVLGAISWLVVDFRRPNGPLTPAGMDQAVDGSPTASRLGSETLPHDAASEKSETAAAVETGEAAQSADDPPLIPADSKTPTPQETQQSRSEIPPHQVELDLEAMVSGASADPPPEIETEVSGSAALVGESVTEIVPSTLVIRDDGSLLLDDRFTISGKGTVEEPFRISWDLLTSAQMLYNPRLGKRQLPERITMLNGKYVSITGYVCMPLAATHTDELLSMLNQWDGCCIGVPPTPYDAVEVKLSERLPMRMNVSAYGAVTGKFVVEPYLAENWLLGLYRMEGAKLSLQ